MLIAYLYRLPVHISFCLYEFVVNFVSVSLVIFGILLYYPYIARPCLAGRRFLRPPTPPAAAVEATRREARRALHILPEAREARRRLRARRAWRCVPRPASPDLCLAPPRPSPLRRAPVHRTLPPRRAAPHITSPPCPASPFHLAAPSRSPPTSPRQVLACPGGARTAKGRA